MLRDASVGRSAGTEYVIRLVAAVVSDNPYHTSADIADAKEQTVVRGILLEYYPDGNLEDTLSVVIRHMSNTTDGRREYASVYSTKGGRRSAAG